MGKRRAVAQVAGVETSFGQRLASLRTEAGFRQIELAANLLPQMAVALGVTIDEMFGRSAQRKLDVAEKRQVLSVIDALIERGQLKRKAESRARASGTTSRSEHEDDANQSAR